ncbi:MAG: ABC transporter permease [Bacillota bacterium]|nr:ABC transporter permease [Bacillota bacterium]
MNRKKTFQMIRTAVAMSAALFVAFFIIILVSDSPFEAIRIFLVKPFSSLRYIGNMIETATPLIFSGLAMTVFFRANLFNLGCEGVYFMAGIAGSMAAIYFALPPGIAQIFCLLAGAVAGIAVMLVSGILRAKYGANEMVVSIMMNSICLGIGCFVLNNVMRDPSVLSLVSYKYRKDALLPKLVPGTNIHLGFLIALGCAGLVWFLLFRTRMGVALRITGTNAVFAETSGINVTRVILIVHVIAGMLAGIGGITECLGMHKRFEWTALPGYGFDGCMIAMLANNNPYGVIGASLFVAYLRVGADLVNRFSDIPTEMISILQSIIVLLISAERLLHRYKQKWMESRMKKMGEMQKGAQV